MAACEYAMMPLLHILIQSRIIRDARLFVAIKEGYAITWLFGKEDALASWPKIALPNVPDLIRMIVRMETSDIKINFELAHPAPSNAA